MILAFIKTELQQADEEAAIMQKKVEEEDNKSWDDAIEEALKRKGEMV